MLLTQLTIQEQIDQYSLILYQIEKIRLIRETVLLLPAVRSLYKEYVGARNHETYTHLPK
ncbi:hypothetical protein [Paenibacillus odorifer]|uniref:hypothetical protein n=1 Tax=Paenibacillus odorifer TaxID=189426 RepID=UPI0021162AA4|nr:hypothetical protein [Paenibacillus odorifer]